MHPTPLHSNININSTTLTGVLSILARKLPPFRPSFALIPRVPRTFETYCPPQQFPYFLQNILSTFLHFSPIFTTSTVIKPNKSLSALSNLKFKTFLSHPPLFHIPLLRIFLSFVTNFSPFCLVQTLRSNTSSKTHLWSTPSCATKPAPQNMSLHVSPAKYPRSNSSHLAPTFTARTLCVDTSNRAICPCKCGPCHSGPASSARPLRVLAPK